MYRLIVVAVLCFAGVYGQGSSLDSQFAATLNNAANQAGSAVNNLLGTSSNTGLNTQLNSSPFNFPLSGTSGLPVSSSGLGTQGFSTSGLGTSGLGTPGLTSGLSTSGFSTSGFSTPGFTNGMSTSGMNTAGFNTMATTNPFSMNTFGSMNQFPTTFNQGALSFGNAMPVSQQTYDLGAVTAPFNFSPFAPQQVPFSSYPPAGNGGVVCYNTGLGGRNTFF